MENQDIMTNEEVMETAEEIVAASSGNWLKIVGAGAGVAIVGYGLYKGGKLLKAKIKAKKEQQAEDSTETCEESDVCGVEEEQE